MVRPSKVRMGFFKKAVACLAAYGFVATSVWAASLAGPAADSLGSTRYVPNVMANAPVAMLQGGDGGIVSSISSNFNATAIPAGDKIWFTAVMKLNGTVPKSSVSIAVHHSTIQFTADGTAYSLNVPDSVVTFSPEVTTSAANFDMANNAQPVWLGRQLNPQPSGNTLLQAFAFPVPTEGLPGGIKNVTWTSSFSSDTANITLNWQWAAAVYTGCVSSAYNSDNVKPTDDNDASIYKNADHAGTPEACKSFVTQGATGGGASNYTGSLSGTTSVTPTLTVVAPTITSTLIPPPNGNRWNNTNVTVSFSCRDTNFAIAACPQPVTVSSEGAGQVITGTAVDQAGDGAVASTSVTINLDKSSPSIAATATSASGSSTVFTLPVTVTFTCADAVSGVGSCPAPIQVTSPGANEVFSGTAIDRAGNTASTSIALNTQRAPLAITRSISPDPINGWNKTNVTISYECTGGVPPVQCPQPANVSAEGAGQIISATATDSIGQSSTIATTLNIDKTVPVIGAAAAPPPNAAGWNTEDVTITYTCADSLSGVGLCPQLQVMSVEGKAQQVSASVSDVAGNTATANTTVNLEKTPPLIVGSIVPAPNAAGWNNSDITVNFNCTPSVSDIVSCPAAVAVREGAAQEVSGTVTDQAGKSNSATITVNVDKTPPVIAALLSPQPNAAGWNNAPVTVMFACSDSGSGIATCSDPILVSTEGANQIVTGTATDKAGNSAHISVTLKIDITPPVINATAAPLPNAAGWNTTPVTIAYACSDSLSGVAVCPAPQVVSSEGKAQQFTASVADQAGNTATSTVVLNIETTSPSIIPILTPSPNAAGWNNTDVSVGFTCTPSISDIVSCQPPVVVSAEGKAQTITGTVSDQAGKSATATAIVNLDKTPPLISASAAPPANAAGWNNTDVTLTYLCSDSLSGIATCPPPNTVATEGEKVSVAGQAVDKAGNSAPVTTSLKIDKTPPLVTVTGTPAANGAGWNNSDVSVTFTCTDELSGIASCPPSRLVASEGQNQSISVQAMDIAGNQGAGSISLSIDKTLPTIVQLTAPDHISKLHGGQISVTVNDNFTVAQVVISVNGNPLGTFSAAPYQATLQVPLGSNPGDTLTITAQATDAAGNTQMATRGVRVAADGVVVGQVLSDVTSFPISGATVQMIGVNAQSDQTDTHGRYSLPASDSHLFVVASSSSPATTTVEREVFVQEGVGTVPVDARLTPLAAPVTMASTGLTLNAGNIQLSVPAGAALSGTSFQLTPISGQGLPGLLPLGWSPVAAFDVRASSAATNLSVTVSKLPSIGANLVTYNPALHAWTMVFSGLQTVNGNLAATLPSPGAYAVVVPDVVDPPLTIPAIGDPLLGVDVHMIPPAATSTGSLNPSIVPPSGGTATASLNIQSPTYVPSGTVIQANVTEKFSLKSGDVVSEENRSEDIVLYSALAEASSTLGAQFPVTPARRFANADLLTGKVHLDILAGREGVRGQPGGSDPLTLSDGTSTLSVPGGALSDDTAISIESTSIEDFIPVSSTFSALQEILVDFSGETLNTPAQLSISASGLNPAGTYLLTKVERLDGVPRIVTVALAQINGTSLTSISTPGLPGVVSGGEYVFYQISAPAGLAQGAVSSSAGPVQALVQTDSLPIASITGQNGQYIVPALAGTANLRATAPHTNLSGGASVQVTAGQTTQANITLSGAVTSAVVSPADGSLGVPASTTITITTTAPLNPLSIVQANLVLLKGTAASGTRVPLRPFVLSTSGTVLSFAPVNNLDPATQYAIQVTGLADTFGSAVVVPTSTFTTKSVAPLNSNPDAITFAFPDQSGNIHVSAPAGALPPGTKVLIVDQSNAVVLSLTALNDRSISGDFPGTVNDVLQVTVTDPNGATISFTRSQFVAPDGSVAVGPGGGTVVGPGNTGLIVPQGALTKAASFKLTPLDQTAFPQLPAWPGLRFGSGLHVDAPDMPIFKQEVKLAFPVPADAPKNAFYYVYRRVTDQDGKTYFETVDHAFVQGTGAGAQVVTASPPFCGYHNPIGNFNIAVAASGAAAFIPQFSPFQDFILMWDIAQVDPNLPGIASPGLIVGLVQQTVPAVLGQSAQTTQPYITHVKVSLDSDPSQIAVYDPNCSTFTLFDPRFGGGRRTITATAPAVAPDGSTQGTTVIHAAVDEVNGVQVDDQTYAIYAGLEGQYRNIGRVTITFPPATPPPPPPQLGIRVFTLDNTGHRVAAGGILQTGTNLVIAFQSKLPVQSASLSGSPLPVTTPDSAPEVQDGQGEKLLFDARVVGTVPIASAGTYTITATALDPLSLTRVSASQSFLAVTPGAGNNSVNTCSAAPPPAPPTTGCTPPKVISISPAGNSAGVSPSIFPQITFSEPVTNVGANIVLSDSKGAVPIRLIGVRPATQQSASLSVADPVQPSDTITSLTIQPINGLRYNETYTLTLNANSSAACSDKSDPNNTIPIAQQPGTPYIVDLNQSPTGPLCLEEFPKPGDQAFQFVTFGPQELGSTNSQYAILTRPAVIDHYAYAGEWINIPLNGLGIFDIAKPSAPVDLGIGTTFVGRATDVAGQQRSPVTGGGLVAVSAGIIGGIAMPANVFLYDVSEPTKPNRVGAVSVASSVNDGIALRLFLKDQFLYASTYRQGLQVINVGQDLDEYKQQYAANPSQVGLALTTEGSGFAVDTIVNTIQLPASPPPGGTLGSTATMYDLKADDFATTDGPTQTLIAATGQLPLVIADPMQSGLSAVVYPPAPSGTFSLNPVLPLLMTSPDQKTNYLLCSGQALALAFLPSTDSSGNPNTKHVAVVVGRGKFGPASTTTSCPGNTPALMVVDLTQAYTSGAPLTPQPIGFLQLPTLATDVTISGTTALIATGTNILLVNLQNPAQPQLAGEIKGNFGNWVALEGPDIVVGTAPNLNSSSSLQTADLSGNRLPVRPETGHCKECEALAGKPINLSNGNVYIDQSDYSLPGLGGGIQLSRTWNSLWQSSSPIEIAGTFGNGWRSNFDERLQFPEGFSSGVTTVKYWRGDGSVWYFDPADVPGRYSISSPLDEHASLQVGTTTSTIIFTDGTQEIFNSAGYLTALRDRNGNQTSINYDSTNRITNVTDAAGRVLNFNYDGTRQVHSIQDATGVVATYTYDSGAHLTKVTYADGSSVNMTYDASDLLLSATDSNGKVLEAHTYDSTGRGLTSTRANNVESISVSYAGAGNTILSNSKNVTSTYGSARFGGRSLISSITGPGCSSCGGRNNSSFSHDGSGNRTSSTDALGRITKYTYDANGNVLNTTTAANSTPVTWQYSYNAFNEVLTATDPMGNVTTNAYDGKGNLLSVTSPAPDSGTPASFTQFAYDSKGELTQITDPLGNPTTLTYTSVGLIATIKDAQGNVTTYGYDARGNRTSVKDAQGNSISFAYDAMNRLTRITYADSSTVRFGYDYRGRRTSVTDQNGKTTGYAYDDADRLLSVTDAASNTTGYAYDTEDNLVSITDANGHTTQFSYDNLGRVTQTLFPSDLTEAYGYDAVGNLVSKTDRKGQTIKYKYDSLDRLTLKTYPDSTVVNYLYDNDSRLTRVTDATGTYQFTFDNMGRLVGTTTQYSFLTGQTFANAYTYDAASNRKSFTAPDGSVNTYSYDTLNRLTGIENSWAGAFGFGYDSLSRRTSLTRPNGVNTSYSYDSLSRLLSVLHRAGTVTLDGANYGYDAAGNRASKTNLLNNITENYTYDPIYQLAQVTQGLTTTESYSYDAVGNRLSSLGMSPYTYNSSNQLTSTPAATFTYDANGNTLTDSSGRQYSWDSENRLTSLTMSSAGTTTFAYDPFGRRIQKSGPLGTVNFVYDEQNVLEEFDQNGSVLARYTRTENLDEPLSELRSGTTSYYEQDGLGSVTSLTDSGGALAKTHTFDSFGNVTTSGGTFTNSFQYTGREFDSELGLYFYRARYYEPRVGRFVSADPVAFAAGVNFYAYAVNDPQNLIDPTGFRACCAKDEEKKIRELLASARDYVADLQAGRPYVAKHGQELGNTICLGFRAPSGRPSKDPLGAATITIKVDPEKEPCVYECLLAHEQVHKKQCESLGTKNADLTVQQKEIPAFKKEIGCYLRILRTGGLAVSPR